VIESDGIRPAQEKWPQGYEDTQGMERHGKTKRGGWFSARLRAAVVNSLAESGKVRFRYETLKSGFLLAHYLFPIALGLSVSLVMHRATGQPFSAAGMVLFTAGIGCAYSLDRLLDRPPDGYPRWVFLALVATFAAAALAGAASAVCLPVKTLSAAIIFAAASLLYRRLKQYPTAKTLLVAVVWTWGGAALPILNHHWAAWDWWSINVSYPLILLLSAGCILCDLKDTEADRRAGVKSLPVVLGASRATAIAILLAATGALIAWSEGRMGLFYSGSLLAAAALFRPLLSRPAVGPLLVDAILSLPGLLILTHMV
jgi:hypothetical protein